MSALAAKQHQTESDTHRHSAVSELAALEAQHDHRRQSFSPAIQRTPVCPCGGGCPACRTIIQPKLEVGAPDDEYEREADEVAEKVMRMPEPNAGMRDEGGSGTRTEDQPVRLKAHTSSPTGIDVSPEGEAQIQSLRGGGRPLSDTERSFLEPRFGLSFQDIRIHAGAVADKLAGMVNARAFAVGRDVFLGSGFCSGATDS